MLTKSKLADSSRTFFVAAVTSVSSPPMTPASAIGPAVSAMTSFSGVSVAVLAVERLQHLAGLRRADDDRRRLAAGPLHQHVVVEGVQRLAPFEHDVVGDVHDVVDRPHAGVGQPPLHPAGGRADRHVRDERRRVPGRQLRVVDLDRAPCPRSARRRRSAPVAAARVDLPVSAATSRATPIIDRQRAMFGSTSSSSTTSPMNSAAGMPTGASASRRMMPSCSSEMPSSKLDMHIASFGMPRSSFGSSVLIDLPRLLGGLVFFREVARAAQAEDDLLAALADGDVRRPGDDRLRLGGPVVERDQLELVGVGVLLDLEDRGR